MIGQHFLSVNKNLSRIRSKQTDADSHGSGFSGTVGSDEPKQFSIFYRKIEISEGVKIAVSFINVLNFKHFFLPLLFLNLLHFVDVEFLHNNFRALVPVFFTELDFPANGLLRKSHNENNILRIGHVGF